MHCAHLEEDINQFIKYVASDLVDKQDFVTDLIDKQEFTSEMIANRLGVSQTTAKRYLRQLVEMGYLTAHGGNRNRTYSRTI